MTPERIKQLQATYHIGIGGSHYVNTHTMLTVDELRALLAIAQRAGETCEWVVGHQFPGVALTACSRLTEEPPDRPCWCGRTVAVRDGRT